MRLYQEASDDKKTEIKKQWPKKLRQLEDAGTRWMRTRGPMAAAISTLLDMQWRAPHPTKWLPPLGDEEDNEVMNFAEHESILEHKVAHYAKHTATKKMWAEAENNFQNKGYASGKPVFQAAKKRTTS